MPVPISAVMTPTRCRATVAVIGLLAAALAFAATVRPTPAPAQGVSLQSAASTKAFADSMGINVHLNYLDTTYADFRSLKPKLQALGIRWIRDGFCHTCPLQHNRLNDLAASGIRAQLVIGSPRYTRHIPAQVAAAEARIPNAIGAFEGANEWDLYGGPTWASTLRAHQAELFRRVKAGTLSGLPVVGPSVARRGNREKLGDISSSLDQGSFHPYAGGLKPGWNLPGELATSALNSGTKPIVATELGYHNAVGTTTTHPGVSERAAAVYMPRMYLDAFSRGIPRTFGYELLDLRHDTRGNTRDYRFGLLRSDFSEKPAYRSLRTLISVLGDTTTAGAPTGLRPRLGGDMKDVRSLLLRGGDGAAHLVLWQDVSVWDRDTKRDLSPAPRGVRVSFGQRVARAEVFDVLRGTTAVTRRDASSSLDVRVPAQPIVVRVR
jgi:hypothetical protein